MVFRFRLVYLAAPHNMSRLRVLNATIIAAFSIGGVLILLLHLF